MLRGTLKYQSSNSINPQAFDTAVFDAIQLKDESVLDVAVCGENVIGGGHVIALPV